MRFHYRGSERREAEEKTIPCISGLCGSPSSPEPPAGNEPQSAVKIALRQMQFGHSGAQTNNK